jgi:hypothetical protein
MLGNTVKLTDVKQQTDSRDSRKFWQVLNNIFFCDFPGRIISITCNITVDGGITSHCLTLH